MKIFQTISFYVFISEKCPILIQICPEALRFQGAILYQICVTFCCGMGGQALICIASQAAGEKKPP